MSAPNRSRQSRSLNTTTCPVAGNVLLRQESSADERRTPTDIEKPRSGAHTGQSLGLTCAGQCRLGVSERGHAIEDAVLFFPDRELVPADAVPHDATLGRASHTVTRRSGLPNGNGLMRAALTTLKTDVAAPMVSVISSDNRERHRRRPAKDAYGVAKAVLAVLEEQRAPEGRGIGQPLAQDGSHRIESRRARELDPAPGATTRRCPPARVKELGHLVAEPLPERARVEMQQDAIRAVGQTSRSRESD